MLGVDGMVNLSCWLKRKDSMIELHDKTHLILLTGERRDLFAGRSPMRYEINRECLPVEQLNFCMICPI